jgi:hypothetical protein
VCVCRGEGDVGRQGVRFPDRLKRQFAVGDCCHKVSAVGDVYACIAQAEDAVADGILQ